MCVEKRIEEEAVNEFLLLAQSSKRSFSQEMLQSNSDNSD